MLQVVGVFDDHDYGKNDGNRVYSVKEESRQLLFDFLGVPVDAPRRQQAGAWDVSIFGVPGRHIRVILLDNRSQQDPLESRFFGRGKQAGQDILGREQWAWLEAELRTRRAEVNIIGAGLQFLSDDKFLAEGWYHFPGSQAKLLSLLAVTNTTGTVFLSGDVHLAEMVSAHFPVFGSLPWHDWTSSGLTHAWTGHVKETLISMAVPNHGSQRYFRQNVGEVDVEWSGEDSRLTARIFSLNGTVVLESVVRIGDLNYSDARDWESIRECASAQLTHGVPLACARVLRDRTPEWTNTEEYLIFFGHVGAALSTLILLGLLVSPVLGYVRCCSRLDPRRYLPTLVFWPLYIGYVSFLLLDLNQPPSLCHELRYRLLLPLACSEFESS